MKKIAFMRSDLGTVGGSERVCANLCNELCIKYEVYLINRYENKYAYKIGSSVKRYFLSNKKRRLRYTLLSDILKLRKFLLENDIFVILSVGRTNIPILPLAVIGTKIKLIQCEHNSLSSLQYKYQLLKDKILNKYIFPIFINFRTNIVVLLTERYRETYKNMCYIQANKLVTIYNFIDDKLFDNINHYDINSKKIITVGRIDFAKGYEYLVEVAEKVFEKYPEWQWHIYGDGDKEYKLKIEQLIKDKGLEKKLILMGNRDNIYDIYQEYAFLVMTSRYEGLPMVLLEAKVKKLPLVSFDIESGPSEIIRDGIDGFLVPPFDVDGMSNKICQLIENTKLRKIFSDNAYGNIDEFKKEKIVEKWINLIEEVEG